MNRLLELLREYHYGSIDIHDLEINLIKCGTTILVEELVELIDDNRIDLEV